MNFACLLVQKGPIHVGVVIEIGRALEDLICRNSRHWRLLAGEGAVRVGKVEYRGRPLGGVVDEEIADAVQILVALGQRAEHSILGNDFAPCVLGDGASYLVAASPR